MRKKLISLLILCSVALTPSASAQQSEAQFLFDVNNRNLLLLQSVLMKDEELTPSEAFDYINATTNFVDIGIQELSDSEENTELKELQLKKESIELIKLILDKEGSK